MREQAKLQGLYAPVKSEVIQVACDITPAGAALAVAQEFARKSELDALSKRASSAREALLRCLPPREGAVDLWLNAALPYAYQQEWALDFSALALIKSRRIERDYTIRGMVAYGGLLGEATNVSVGQTRKPT